MQDLEKQRRRRVDDRSSHPRRRCRVRMQRRAESAAGQPESQSPKVRLIQRTPTPETNVPRKMIGRYVFLVVVVDQEGIARSKNDDDDDELRRSRSRGLDRTYQDDG